MLTDVRFWKILDGDFCDDTRPLEVRSISQDGKATARVAVRECHLMLQDRLGTFKSVGFRLRPFCFVENNACDGRLLAAACFDV